MPACRLRLPLLIVTPLVLVACASAGDRLNEGIQLQAQGRYMEAVYRYADALEKDATLVDARDRMLAAGDTALSIAMDEADALERRDNPVDAAARYRSVDQMLARIRSVGQRLVPPSDYGTIRRGVFDAAIEWQMARGREAADDGRWTDARRLFIAARGDLLPSRDQVEESLEAETQLMLDWSGVELTDGHPRSAYGVAQEALEVRASPSRDVVLAVRDLQQQALEEGTVVVAIPPLTAADGVREYVGPQFEIQLDDDLLLDHWSQPPLFVKVADPVVLRSQLRGLLRGVSQSPLIVGHALELVGADLGVLIQVSSIEVLEQDVKTRTREAQVVSSTRGENREEPMTAQYDVVSGNLSYAMQADVVLVDGGGREVDRFTATGHQVGPFERAEYDGDPARLQLDDAAKALFDPQVQALQKAHIEEALKEQLAVAIATGTYDTVLSRIP